VSEPPIAVPFSPEPSVGRVFRSAARVRLADASPRGRLRLDALARMLQDVAADDVDDAGVEGSVAWVVRRTEVVVQAFPRYRDQVTLATWCGGLGSRWAARRTSVRSATGAPLVEADSLWVPVDQGSMRPLPHSEEFLAVYGPAAGGRVVRARLGHDTDPPADVRCDELVFPLRFSDVDVLAHVNNAVSWAVVEELLARRRDLRAPLRASVEHRAPLDGRAVRVRWIDEPDALQAWLADADAGTAAPAAVTVQVGRHRG
jgi:acyl-ACP thioesterase